MKDSFKIVAAWVVIIGGIVGWWVFAKNDESKTKSTEPKSMEQARKESIHKAIIELADSYNAVVNWREPLRIKPFTIEVEGALLRKDNRPVLFLATVEDVERKENKYLVRFVTDNLDVLPVLAMFEFVLDCNDEQTKKITQQQIEFWERYAVVAEIQKVRKVIFGLKADNYTEEPEISIDTQDVFVATGKCLDLLFVGDYFDYSILEKKKGDN
jgi:hypothetical protein